MLKAVELVVAERPWRYGYEIVATNTIRQRQRSTNAILLEKNRTASERVLITSTLAELFPWRYTTHGSWDVSSAKAGRHWLHTNVNPRRLRTSKSLRFIARPLVEEKSNREREIEGRKQRLFKIVWQADYLSISDPKMDGKWITTTAAPAADIAALELCSLCTHWISFSEAIAQDDIAIV